MFVDKPNCSFLCPSNLNREYNGSCLEIEEECLMDKNSACAAFEEGNHFPPR